MSHNEVHPSSSQEEGSSSPPPPPRPKQVIERPGDMLKSIGLVQEGKESISADIFWGHLANWKNKYEVWPVVYGAGICGLMAGASGAFIIHQVRKYLYLGHMGRLSSYFGTSFVPCLALGLSHQLLITSDILEQRTRCPVCVQVKAAVVQVGFGVIFPTLLAPFAVFPTISNMGKSFKVPKLIQEPRAVFDYAKQMYKPWIRRLPYIAAVQILISMGITYLEQETYFNTVLPEVRLKNVPVHKEPELPRLLR